MWAVEMPRHYPAQEGTTARWNGSEGLEQQEGVVSRMARDTVGTREKVVSLRNTWVGLSVLEVGTQASELSHRDSWGRR